MTHITSENELNEKWLTDVEKLRNAINKAINNAMELMLGEPQLCAKLKAMQTTVIEKEIQKSLGKLCDFFFVVVVAIKRRFSFVFFIHRRRN